MVNGSKQDAGLEEQDFQLVFEKYGMTHGSKVYVSWMSTTYIFVINRKAFDYLPAGLTEEDVIKGSEKWSYDALLNWVKNIKESTGSSKLGFPVCPEGLFYRFLHGHIYPSYTAAQAKNFDSADAVKMWSYLKELWKYTNPLSTTWDSLDKPLLDEEIWIGWNHFIRIKHASNDKFVAAPVPRGPCGRGFTLVIAGLSIPDFAPNKKDAWKLIDYLTKPETEREVFKSMGFLPTIDEAYEGLPEGTSKVLGDAVATQFCALDAIVAIIPSIAADGGEFNNLYMQAWERIVLKNEDLDEVLKEIASKLRKLFEEADIKVP